MRLFDRIKAAIGTRRPVTRLGSSHDVLNRSKRITILAGAGCAGAHAELIASQAQLNAPIVHAMRGKGFVEYDNPLMWG